MASLSAAKRVVIKIGSALLVDRVSGDLRNDWLLLGVFGIMLLALGWVGIKMLPGAIEQVTLLLNLGAVQEDERVLIEGVPYRVRKLDFYTDFENPSWHKLTSPSSGSGFWFFLLF